MNNLFARHKSFMSSISCPNPQKTIYFSQISSIHFNPNKALSETQIFVACSLPLPLPCQRFTEGHVDAPSIVFGPLWRWWVATAPAGARQALAGAGGWRHHRFSLSSIKWQLGFVSWGENGGKWMKGKRWWILQSFVGFEVGLLDRLEIMIIWYYILHMILDYCLYDFTLVSFRQNDDLVVWPRRCVAGY